MTLPAYQNQKKSSKNTPNVPLREILNDLIMFALHNEFLSALGKEKLKWKKGKLIFTFVNSFYFFTFLNYSKKKSFKLFGFIQTKYTLKKIKYHKKRSY